MLVYPKFETHIITPPLGLGYLAATLLKEGHEVILLDCVLKNIDIEKFRQILKNEKPDVVGVNAMTTYYSSAKKYVTEAKKQGITTVMGGPHSTALPKETLEDSGADFILIGEAEKSFPNLLNSLEKKKNLMSVKGICFKKNNKIIMTPEEDLIQNLDELPLPSWNMMNPNDYPIAPHGAFLKRFPCAPIITTRGCSFNCTFCASKCTWRQKLRFRDPKKVVDEIEMLNKKFGVKEFHFEDDNFTLKREHALEVCKEIIRRKLDIVWACPNGVRIDRLDEELLKWMKKSGCYLLAFGLESGDQKILNTATKNLDLSQVSKALRMVKKIGIQTWGFFILGLPGETMESALKTIKFARNNEFDRAQFCIFTPLPGSEIFEKWTIDKKNLNWNDFNFFNIVYTDKLSEEQLRKLHKRAFREFYLRPKIFFNLLRDLKLKQIKWLAKRAFDYKIFKK